MIKTDRECWFASDADALQYFAGKMNVGNCKQSLCLVLIIFPLRVAESGLNSQPNQPQMQNTSLLQFSGTGEWPQSNVDPAVPDAPHRGTKVQETSEAVTHKAVGGQICS